MKRAWLAIFFILGMTTGRAADAAATYHFTPNLAREGNQIILALGGRGWPGILGLNAVAVLAISLGTFYWWRAPLSYARPPQGQDDVWSFASYNYFGRVHPPGTFLWRLTVTLPKNWRLFAQFMGMVMPPMLMLASALAVCSWFALHEWRWAFYKAAYRQMFPLFPFALLVPFYLWVCGWFFRGEWQRWQFEQAR